MRLYFQDAPSTFTAVGSASPGPSDASPDAADAPYVGTGGGGTLCRAGIGGGAALSDAPE